MLRRWQALSDRPSKTGKNKTVGACCCRDKSMFVKKKKRPKKKQGAGGW